MNLLLQNIYVFLPLLLITTGALASEYAGRMACFLDGIINLGAFACFAFTCLTKNAAAGILLSCTVCVAAVYALERLSVKLKANIFLASLAMNILFSALCSLLAAQIFGTRSVLTSAQFSFSAEKAKLITSLICLAVVLLEFYLLYFTKAGLCIRVSGTDSQMLEAKGISSDRIKCISWLMAALSGSLCGCTLALRLSSYVPGMAAGRGWTALAAVFLGRKKPSVTIIAVLVFSCTEFASSYLPNIQLFENIPSSVLLALPYFVSLLMILFVPAEK